LAGLNVNRLIVDYVSMTERLGPLDFGGFIAVWLAADAIAEATPEMSRDAVLTFVGEVAPHLVDSA
jgi:hypothetical protein